MNYKIYQVSEDSVEVLENASTVTVGETGRGRVRATFHLPEHPPFKDGVLVVLRSPIGFRGWNAHTGFSLVAWRERKTPGVSWPEFPGQIVATGVIAQGDAGRMGSGEQLVAWMKPGDQFRIYIGGRRYGSPKAYYYRVDKDTIHVVSDQDLPLLSDEEQEKLFPGGGCVAKPPQVKLPPPQRFIAVVDTWEPTTGTYRITDVPVESLHKHTVGSSRPGGLWQICPHYLHYPPLRRLVEKLLAVEETMGKPAPLEPGQAVLVFTYLGGENYLYPERSISCRLVERLA